MRVQGCEHSMLVHNRKETAQKLKKHSSLCKVKLNESILYNSPQFCEDPYCVSLAFIYAWLEGKPTYRW
jgi:hypothetical protein